MFLPHFTISITNIPYKIVFIEIKFLKKEKRGLLS